MADRRVTAACARCHTLKISREACPRCGTTTDAANSQSEGRIRTMHGYRPLEWANLVRRQVNHEGRLCYIVRFPDGEMDWWPVDDQTVGYELYPRPEPEAKAA